MLRRAVLAATGLALAACHTSSVSPSAGSSPDSLSIRRDIEYLASEKLAGRLTGTAGNDSAATYLARRYASFNLEATSPGYLQKFVARPPAHAGPSPSLPTQNVFALLRGSDPVLRNQYVVIGAHFDHLGTSTENALDPEAKGAVRRGADDNASGTAAVVELARLFSRVPTRRSIIFANFSGEEEGVLGSSYFVDHLPVPTDSIVAMLNFDMVGRMRDDKLIVFGSATGKEFRPFLERANVGTNLKIAAPDGDGFGPSDHSSFYAKNIPVLHFFTDSHADYHKASDTPEKINAAGEARIVAVAERVAREIGDQAARPTFVRIARAATSARSGSNVYLGSIPDMAGGDTPGLRLSGVSPGSPAEIAGMKAGDIIVEFAGKPVKDLYEYSDALYAHKPGDEVSVVVLRGTQRVTLKVKLAQRGG